jgi:histidine triad (HIT) family protein
MSSIFTKIIAKEMPAYILFENEWIISFLTIAPIHPGHALIVPKIEVDHFSDVPEPYYSEVYRFAKPLSKAIKNVSGCVRVGTAVVGLEVPHFHLHLIPLFQASDLNFKNAKMAAPEDLLQMQLKIKENLG